MVMSEFCAIPDTILYYSSNTECRDDLVYTSRGWLDSEVGYASWLSFSLVELSKVVWLISIFYPCWRCAFFLIQSRKSGWLSRWLMTKLNDCCCIELQLHRLTHTNWPGMAGEEQTRTRSPYSCPGPVNRDERTYYYLPAAGDKRNRNSTMLG